MYQLKHYKHTVSKGIKDTYQYQAKDNINPHPEWRTRRRRASSGTTK